MFLRRAACGLAIVLLAVSTVHAQAASPDSPASDRDEDYGLVHPGEDPQNEVGWPLLRHIADDQRTFWTAPFRLHADDLKTVVPFLGITAGFMAGDSAISRQVPDSPSSLKRSLDLSNFTAYSMIGGAGAMFFWGHLTHNDHKREAGFLSGEAAINSAAIVYFTKSIARRERPMEANGDGAFFQGGSSFPSEHAAVAWSVASVVAHEYPGWLTQFLAYGAATGVSLTRVTAKQHFPADVIVGSALGWYLGRQVYRAHHDPELGGAAWGSTQRFPEEKPRDTNSMGSPHVSLDSGMYPAF